MTATLVGPRRCRPAPARATRVGARPRPRMRPLADVLTDLVRTAPGTRAARAGAPDAPDPAERAPVPDPRPAALRVVRALAEVLDGTRPAAHLRPVCDDELYRGEVVRLAARAAPRPRVPGRGGRVRGVRVCTVTERVAEIAAVVHRDGRARALAGRLEHDGRGWRLTVLEVG